MLHTWSFSHLGHSDYIITLSVPLTHLWEPNFESKGFLLKISIVNTLHSSIKKKQKEACKFSVATILDRWPVQLLNKFPNILVTRHLIFICIGLFFVYRSSSYFFRKLVMLGRLSSRILREVWANTKWTDSYNGARAIKPSYTWEKPANVRSECTLKEELYPSPSSCFLPTTNVLHCMHVPLRLRLTIPPYSPRGVVLAMVYGPIVIGWKSCEIAARSILTMLTNIE